MRGWGWGGGAQKLPPRFLALKGGQAHGLHPRFVVAEIWADREGGVWVVRAGGQGVVVGGG